MLTLLVRLLTLRIMLARLELLLVEALVHSKLTLLFTMTTRDSLLLVHTVKSTSYPLILQVSQLCLSQLFSFSKISRHLRDLTMRQLTWISSMTTVLITSLAPPLALLTTTTQPGQMSTKLVTSKVTLLMKIFLDLFRNTIWIKLILQPPTPITWTNHNGSNLPLLVVHQLVSQVSNGRKQLLKNHPCL